jgi:toxin-antitoxin system PIN domain toxin
VTTYLLDVNVLIALAWPSHTHHSIVRSWFREHARTAWATCPITQAAFIRISSNPAIIADAVRPEQALEKLKDLTGRSGHYFWPDDVSMAETSFSFPSLLIGHRQVTDAYLLALALENNGCLATLDRGLFEMARAGGGVFLLA